MGVWFKNVLKLVDEFISVLFFDSDVEVMVGDEKMCLWEVLIYKLELILSYFIFVKVY